MLWVEVDNHVYHKHILSRHDIGTIDLSKFGFIFGVASLDASPSKFGSINSYLRNFASFILRVYIYLFA